MSSAEQLASVTPLPGLINRGPDPELLEQAIASPLPSFDLAIDDVTAQRPERFDGGHHQTWRFRLTNGATYAGRLTISANNSFDTLLSHRLPWCTELGGLYQVVDEEHARRGSSGIRVTPRPTTLQATGRLLDAVLSDNNMLAQDAYVQHLVLDHIDTLGLAAPAQAIETGDSNGAMTNFAAQAYAPRFKRKLPYNDITDPCLEHAPNPRNATPEGIVRNAKYFAFDEPKEFVRGLFTYSPRQLLTLRKTASLRPAFLVDQAARGVALFAGKSGGFTDHIPNDSVTALRFFRHSEFNHRLHWLRRVAPFDGIYPYQEEGSHLTIFDWETQESTIDRVQLVQELLQSAVSPDELRAELVVQRVQQLRLSALSAQLGRVARQPARTVG